MTVVPGETAFCRVSWRGLGTVPGLSPAEQGKRIVGVTIGNFDGLHLGHQQLFHRLQSELAQRTLLSLSEARLPYSVMFTFHPHPRVVIAKAKGETVPELAITSLRQRMKLAREFHFDLCISAHFTTRFAELEPERFVDRFLLAGLSAELVVVGHDWAFGRHRAGGVELLQEIGKKKGFAVIVVPPVEVQGVRVSTTLLREVLQSGDVESAEKILGRRYSLAGKVRHGERRGGKLGFPTANLEFPRLLLPKDGVYAGWAGAKGLRFKAVANLGIRPTFGGGRRVLEVHVLELDPAFERDFYGDHLEFEFVARLRDEQKFSGIDQLKVQIGNDIESARRILAGTN